MTAVRLRLLILPEDTGEDGFETIKLLVRKAIEFVRPELSLWSAEGEQHRWIDPRSTDALKLIGAARWKVRKATDVALLEMKRDLQRAVVTHLLLHEELSAKRVPVGFVFFHHDGDDAWSAHPSCTLCSQFREFKVELEQTIRAVVDRDARIPLAEKDLAVQRAMTRLIVVEPHWSIESWLLGQSARAATVCGELHGGQHDTPTALWRLPWPDLEEVKQPKEACCFKDAHNLALARSFEAGTAYGSSPSFTALVDAVVACADLAEALRSLAGV